MKAKIHTQAIDHPEVAAAVAGIVSVVLHFTGDNPLTPEALGVALTAAALPLVMFVIRTIARMISSPEDTEAGFARLPSVLLMLLISVVWLCLGCGSSYHLATGGMKVSKQADGQTCAQIYGDGDDDVARICFKTVKIKLPPEVCNGSE